MKSTKNKLLILSDWYLPAVKAGGPVRSVVAIVEILKPYFEISVLTSDRDIGDVAPYKDVISDSWLEKEGFRIKYLSPAKIKVEISNELKLDYSKIYLNSFFSFNFAIQVLWQLDKVRRKSVVLAPRGMLAEGALGVKPFKKSLFLIAAKLFRVYDFITWHASTQLEKDEILSIFPNAKIETLRNLSLVKIQNSIERKPSNNIIKLVTVARISPVKNLLFLIDVFSKLRCHSQLDIIGPIEDERYYSECSELVTSKALNVNFLGSIDNSKIAERFDKYDLFILPTLGENFGHSILEALASCLPVLISDRTSWNQVSSVNAGKVISLKNPQDWVNWIEQFAKKSDIEVKEFRIGAQNLALEVTRQKDLSKEYLRMFS